MAQNLSYSSLTKPRWVLLVNLYNKYASMFYDPSNGKSARTLPWSPRMDASEHNTYFTVTLFAKFLGLSGSAPLKRASW